MKPFKNLTLFLLCSLTTSHMHTAKDSELTHELITADKAHELAPETHEQELQELFPLSIPTSTTSKKTHVERFELFKKTKKLSETEAEKYQRLFPLGIAEAAYSEKISPQQVRFSDEKKEEVSEEHKDYSFEKYNQKIFAARASLANCRLGVCLLAAGISVWSLNQSVPTDPSDTSPSYVTTLCNLYVPACVSLGSGLLAREGYKAWFKKNS